MLGALIIVFREVIEAGLIVGIVLAATRGVLHRGQWVAGGVAAGLAGAAIFAIFAGQIANALAGVGQELFNASVLALAVVMLGWHNIWMASHGRDLAVQMKGMGTEVAQGKRSLMALAIVVCVAVLREGSEVVLFLYGVAISGDDTARDLMVGGALGLVLGGALSALTFFGLVRIPPKYLFGTTTTLITLLAAGLAGQCAVFLQQAGLVNALSNSVWNTSEILSDKSIPGRVLHTLIGYSDEPSGLQVLIYCLTLAVIFVMTRVVANQVPRRAHPVPAE